MHAIYVYGYHIACTHTHSQAEDGRPRYAVTLYRLRLTQRPARGTKIPPPTWTSVEAISTHAVPSPHSYTDDDGGFAHQDAMEAFVLAIPSDLPCIGRIPEGDIGTWVRKTDSVLCTNMRKKDIVMLFPECLTMPKAIAFDYVRDRI